MNETATLAAIKDIGLNRCAVYSVMPTSSLPTLSLHRNGSPLSRFQCVLHCGSMEVLLAAHSISHKESDMTKLPQRMIEDMQVRNSYAPFFYCAENVSPAFHLATIGLSAHRPQVGNCRAIQTVRISTVDFRARHSSNYSDRSTSSPGGRKTGCPEIWLDSDRSYRFTGPIRFAVRNHPLSERPGAVPCPSNQLGEGSFHY